MIFVPIRSNYSRLLTGSRRVFKANIYTRTHINPINYKLSRPEESQKSVLIFSTPPLLDQVTQEALKLNERNEIQVVVAGVDKMVPHNYHHGVSEIWFDEYIKIQNCELLPSEEGEAPPRERDGVRAVRIDRNWHEMSGELTLNLNTSTQVKLYPASTIFSTGVPLTLFFLQPSNIPQLKAGKLLKELELSFPQKELKIGAIQYEDRWIPLNSPESDELIVTDCVGNLLKSINGLPASKFLQENHTLMHRKSKDIQVHVKIIEKGGQNIKRYRVIAGGGEWGAKSNILAMSPEARPKKGDSVEFYMTSTENDSKLQTSSIDCNQAIIFECATEDTTYYTENGKTPKTLEIAGCSCEKGFEINNIQNKAPGDKVCIYV